MALVYGLEGGGLSEEEEEEEEEQNFDDVTWKPAIYAWSDTFITHIRTHANLFQTVFCLQIS